MDGLAHKRLDYDFMRPLAPAPRGRTTERVEEALREAVVTLALMPGAFIDKASVCERLGVSRFPVSAALDRLAAEGLVEILPQRGTRVAPIRMADVRQSMLIRRALEAAVVEEVSRVVDAGTLAALEANLAAQERAVAGRDRRRFHALDLVFHDRIVGALGFDRARGAIDGARAGLDRVRRLLASPRRHALTFAEHRLILAALAARDPLAARRAMEAHLDAVMVELVDFAAAHPDVVTTA